MKLLACVMAVLLSSTQLPPKEGKVASVTDPKADFSKLTTYVWEKGQETFDPTAHKTIVDAIDAEMAARGFRKVTSAASDVKIRYHTVVRTDIPLDKLDEIEKGTTTQAQTKNLGRLVIVMRDGSNRRLWAADTVQPLSSDRQVAYKEIAPIVKKLFETYPAKGK